MVTIFITLQANDANMNIALLDGDQISDSLQHKITKLYKQLNDTIRQLSLNQLIESNKSLVFAICKADNNVVGIALMVSYKVISGHKGMIEDVVVDQGYRGKGIGRKLMERLLEEARNRNLDEVLLFSGHHRTAAIKLYKSLGFQLKDSGLYRLNLN